MGGQAARYAAAAAQHQAEAGEKGPAGRDVPPAPSGANGRNAAGRPPVPGPGGRGSAGAESKASAIGNDGNGRRQSKETPPPVRMAGRGQGQDAKGAGKDYGQDDCDDNVYTAEAEGDDEDGGAAAAALDAFHRTVQDVFEEEESLLNLHMSIIQENAELLTEEGRLLQQIQGDDNDIDSYAARLDEILEQKQKLINKLKEKLDHFRSSLQREERESQSVGNRFAPY